MAEAVIAATARSPIGRAVKGSLKDLRPDDLAAAMVQAQETNSLVSPRCVSGGQGMVMILERLS